MSQNVTQFVKEAEVIWRGLKDNDKVKLVKNAQAKRDGTLLAHQAAGGLPARARTLQLRARASLVLAPERAGRPRPAARPRWAVTRAALNVTSHEKYSHNKKTGIVANAPYSDR